MKNNNHLNIKFQCQKEELLEHLQEYSHVHDCVRVRKNDDYYVCLELIWQQHSNYLLNICI